MNVSEAILALSFQSASNPDTGHPRWESGFVTSLRPYKGEIVEDNLHEIMESIYVLFDSLEKAKIEHTVISYLWAIVHLGKQWGYGNREVFAGSCGEKIELYTDMISWAVFCALDGSGREQAFEMYFREYPEKKPYLTGKYGL